MEKYSETTIDIVEGLIIDADVCRLVEHAISYVSAYKDEIIEYVFENIEDSEELYDDERKYLIERIEQTIEELI